MALRLTAAADRDLANIYLEGIEKHGLVAADAYYDRLSHTLDTLASQPLMARERMEISPPVRAHPSGEHIIIYEVVGDDVLVIRVRHHREDWTNDPL